MSSQLHLRHNIEIKARLHDIQTARRVAEQVMTARLPDERQRDTYFDCRRGRLKLREINQEQAQLIAYERANEQHSRASAYTITPIAEPKSFTEALEAALGILVIVEKRREIYLYQTVRIHLDEVQDLGCFLEFEAVLGGEASQCEGHELVAELRRKFGIADADLIAVSYSDLLLRQ